MKFSLCEQFYLFIYLFQMNLKAHGKLKNCYKYVLKCCPSTCYCSVPITQILDGSQKKVTNCKLFVTNK